MFGISLREVFADCWRELLCAIGVSLSFLFIDGRLVMFFLTLAALMISTVVLSIHRMRWMGKLKKEIGLLESLCVVGVTLENSTDLNEARDSLKTINLADGIMGQLQSEKSEGFGDECSPYLTDMINSFGEGRMETIPIQVNDIANKSKEIEALLFKKDSGRLIGVFTCLAICLSLIFICRSTLVANAFASYDLLPLVLRLLCVLTFMTIELLGSRKSKRDDGRLSI